MAALPGGHDRHPNRLGDRLVDLIYPPSPEKPRQDVPVIGPWPLRRSSTTAGDGHVAGRQREVEALGQKS
jgi:hypothetical protein